MLNNHKRQLQNKPVETMTQTKHIWPAAVFAKNGKSHVLWTSMSDVCYSYLLWNGHLQKLLIFCFLWDVFPGKKGQTIRESRIDVDVTAAKKLNYVLPLAWNCIAGFEMASWTPAPKSDLQTVMHHASSFSSKARRWNQDSEAMYL